LEASKGSDWFFSINSYYRLVYCVNESLKETLAEAVKMGQVNRAHAFFTSAVWLLGDMEKTARWLVMDNLFYAQSHILDTSFHYARMLMLLDNKPPHRDAVIKVMEYAPDLIESVFKKPMQGEMARSEIEKILAFYRKFPQDNLELIKLPVKDYMSDGQIRTVTTLVKHFNIDAHAIYLIFDFLTEMNIVCRTSVPVRLTPKSRATVEEAAFVFTGE